MAPTKEELTNLKMRCQEAFTEAGKVVMGQKTTFTIDERLNYFISVHELLEHEPAEAWRLYERYMQTMRQIVLLILRSLEDKSDATLLMEFTSLLSKYRLVTKWLGKMFEFLERRFLEPYGSNNSFDIVSHNYFQELVINRLYPELRTAALLLIAQERNGWYTDHNLLKSVLLVFTEFQTSTGVGCYEDFEMEMLKQTNSYYSQSAPNWLMSYSCGDYLQKISWCLIEEKGRAAAYMASGTVAKLMKVVRVQLLDQPMQRLIEKKKWEDWRGETVMQEMLSQYAGLNLKEGSAESTVSDWLSAYLATSNLKRRVS